MNRRSFLKLFAAAGPVAAAAPTYFFAPVGGWKSNMIVNPFASCPWMVGDQVIGIQERLNGSLRVIDAYVERVTVGIELNGIPYWHVKPPYLSDTYLGIARTMHA